MSQFSSDPYGGGPHLAFPRLTTAVKALIIANVAVFVLQFLVMMVTGADPFVSWFGVSLASVLGRPYIGVFQLITYQFVHGGFGHILFNMLVLYFFGTMVEEIIGPVRLYRLYFLSGILGGLFYMMSSAITGNTAVPCVGASGACFGIMTYAALLRPNARVIFIIVIVPLWLVAGALGLYAVYEMLLSWRVAAGGVAHSAHVGGIVYALLLYRFGAKLSDLKQGLADRARAREAKKRVDRDRELDRLLGKISEVGMSGLTESERRFLARYSKDSKK